MGSLESLRQGNKMKYALICNSNMEMVGLFPITNKKILSLKSLFNINGLSFDIISEEQLCTLIGYRNNPVAAAIRIGTYLPSIVRAGARLAPKAGKSFVKGSKGALKQVRSLTKSATKTSKGATKLATEVGKTALATEIAVGSMKRTGRAITGEEEKKKKKKAKVKKDEK